MRKEPYRDTSVHVQTEVTRVSYAEIVTHTKWDLLIATIGVVVEEDCRKFMVKVNHLLPVKYRGQN